MSTATISVQPHYSILKLEGMGNLRALFPDGKADDLNFVLFSTSGVHGSYSTIEDVEEHLKVGGGDSDTLTITVVHPRIICMRYGDVPVTLEDIPYLKKLRASSWAAVCEIGKH